MCCECTMLHKDAVSGLNASRRHQITESAAARVSLSHSSLFTENVPMTKALWPTESRWAHYSCARPFRGAGKCWCSEMKGRFNTIHVKFLWHLRYVYFFFLLLNQYFLEINWNECTVCTVNISAIIWKKKSLWCFYPKFSRKKENLKFKTSRRSS